MAAVKYLILVVVALTQSCQAFDSYEAKPGLLDVLTSLQLTSFVDGIKKCGLDRIINHEGIGCTFSLVMIVYRRCTAFE
jgi:hypothetical protein